MLWRHLLFAGTVATACITLSAGLAQATVITTTFVDDQIHWPGWNTVSSPYSGTYSNAGINAMDHIGVPDISGGTATIETNGVTAWLTSITINYNSNLEPGYNNILRYGDLFLATGADPTVWNYVVQGDHSVGSGTAVGYNSATTLAVRSFSSGISQIKGVNDNDYLLTNTSTQRNSNTGWDGFVIRYDQPWALSALGWSTGTSDGSAGFTGWQDNNANGSSTWMFDDQQVLLDPSQGDLLTLRLGFSPQCANDVLLEDVGFLLPHDTPPVPEPCTLAIWSLLGAVGMTTGWLRRRKTA